MSIEHDSKVFERLGRGIGEVGPRKRSVAKVLLLHFIMYDATLVLALIRMTLCACLPLHLLFKFTFLPFLVVLQADVHIMIVVIVPQN